MELKVTSLDGKSAGSVTVSDGIFGLDPRADLIHRCVVWQLAYRVARIPAHRALGKKHVAHPFRTAFPVDSWRIMAVAQCLPNSQFFADFCKITLKAPRVLSTEHAGSPSNR